MNSSLNRNQSLNTKIIQNKQTCNDKQSPNDTMCYKATKQFSVLHTLFAVYAEINGQVKIVLSQICFKMFLCATQHNGILAHVNTQQLSKCMK